MSEYQYYEFQAIDQPLTEEEQQAVQLLLKLRDLARYQGQEPVFHQRLNHIYEQYSRRSALLRRLRNVGLYQSQT